ncbi:MAG: MFS transporter [Candidatus Microthrix sp.]|uniref:Drug resistance transporter, EmrB/QacA subfamily n=1 Tax=Candidatus Neomicrothrix parvicella RN1 TaxID=1229780 RepID=R4YWQ1_9ACTN|nr:MFS transporter [Candidatus Microthrix parvicella]MBP7405263.1 MFS transporter [Candidatus Microthrix sp.]CCM62420.1 Drug resistance transporter, EmrB/QacA subfamily [Candidatus Microthrix parvicella RN1]
MRSLTVEQAYDKRWWTLGVLCASLSVISIDNTILNVALPNIVDNLGASGSDLQWIVDAYVVVFAGLLLTSGALGDKFGRKLMLTGGLALFAATSAFAAFSGSPGALIGARGLMGIAGAAIFPSTLSILTNTFEGPERGRAIGIWAAVSGLGIAVGPLLGGFLLEHFWWGSVFLVNVPIALGAIVAGRFLVPETVGERDRPLDPMGSLLSIVGLTGVLYAIIEAPGAGWLAPETLIPGAIGVAVLAAFVVWELRNPHPMLDVSFFSNPRFSAASATITLVFFALFGSTFLLTQYFQFVLGYSPLKTGMLTAPVALGIMTAGPLAPRLVEKVGTKLVVLAGLFVVGVALLCYGSEFLMESVPLGMGVRLIFGWGMGLVMPPATESIMGSLPRARAGVGSAVNDTTRQTGGALGVAVIGSIFAAQYRSVVKIPADLPVQVRDGMADSIGSGLRIAKEMKLPVSDLVRVHDAAAPAFVSGMQMAVVFGAVVVAIAAVVAWRYLPAREAGPVTEGEADRSVGHPDGGLHGRVETERLTIIAGD